MEYSGSNGPLLPAPRAPLLLTTVPRVFAFVDEFPDATQQARLLAVASQIGVAAPEWCSIRGTSFRCDAVDQNLLALGASSGFSVWPVACRSTGPRRRAARDGRVPPSGGRLIAAWAAEAGVGGITLDVEGVDPGRASAFTNFVKLLGRDLHDDGRSLAVYVPRRTGAKASA